MVRIIGYHATESRNAFAIRQYGLLKRKTTEHNYHGCDWLDGQPAGVYMLPAGWKGSSDWGLEAVQYGHAVVRADLLGLPIVPDPEIEGAICCTQDIPADRCTVIMPRKVVHTDRGREYTDWGTAEELGLAA